MPGTSAQGMQAASLVFPECGGPALFLFFPAGDGKEVTQTCRPRNRKDEDECRDDPRLVKSPVDRRWVRQLDAVPCCRDTQWEIKGQRLQPPSFVVDAIHQGIGSRTRVGSLSNEISGLGDMTRTRR